MRRTARQGSGRRRYRVRNLPGHEVNDRASHGHRVVGEALVVPADERDVHGRLNTLVPPSTEDGPQHLAVQVVHDVVVALDLAGGRDITRCNDAARLRDDPLGYLT